MGEGVIECVDQPGCKIALKCEKDASGYERCTGRLRVCGRSENIRYVLSLFLVV